MRYYILAILISMSFTQVFSTYDYVGSRATAMSGAATTGSDIESAIFHNPAQLSSLKGKKIISGFSHLYDLEFLTYTHFGLSYDSYAINFEKGWKHGYCPKATTLFQYGYEGPFKTKDELRFRLKELNKIKRNETKNSS